MTKKSADLLVGELADHFARVLDAVLPSGKLALVDFPDHSNVGDSAIWRICGKITAFPPTIPRSPISTTKPAARRSATGRS